MTELCFWKYKTGVPQNDKAVYEKACCDGEITDELEILPINEIMERLSGVFSDWTVQNDGKDFEKEDRGSFRIFKTPQTVRFDCYDLREFDTTAIMAVMFGFGIELYDPQTSIRYNTLNTPKILRHEEWDNADFVVPKELLLDKSSSLADALRVFYAAGGYDFFKVINPEKYADRWLEFIGGLYADIEDDVYKPDGGHFTFPLSEDQRQSLIEQGVPERFTIDF